MFEVTVGSSNFPRRFHPKVSKGLSGFNDKSSYRLSAVHSRFTLCFPNKVDSSFWMLDFVMYARLTAFGMDYLETLLG